MNTLLRAYTCDFKAFVFVQPFTYYFVEGVHDLPFLPHTCTPLDNVGGSVAIVIADYVCDHLIFCSKPLNLVRTTVTSPQSSRKGNSSTKLTALKHISARQMQTSRSFIAE